jgi:hypothetical protein
LPGSKVERPRLDQPFVTGVIDTDLGPVPVVAPQLTWRDRVGGYMVRWRFRRFTYTVDPGLYAVGAPTERSPVLVSANYKLSFDALRRELSGRDAWILVLDTRGINVWCAAGKGTFGTEELLTRIDRAGLARIVSHGIVVVPQLGAPGVSAPEIRRRSAFRVIFGPVLASDLPAFLEGGMRATAEMRRANFGLLDRLVLVPVELVGATGIALVVVAGAVLAGGLGPGVWSLSRAVARADVAVAAPLIGLLAGAIVAPLLLPLLPFRMFSAKGALVGAAGAVLLALAPHPGSSWADLVAAALFITAGSSFVTMNFTGTSTFTSLSGVQVEMRRALPLQMAAAAAAALLWLAGGWLR